MSYYRGNHRICKTPTAAATWGVDPVRYRRALLRINRNAAARWAELRALRYSNPNDWPDDGESKSQGALPFPL